MSSENTQDRRFWKRHWVLLLPMLVHLFFVSYGASDTEFWGEDEAAVINLAGDQWVGLSGGDKELLMSLGRAGHPPLRYLAAMPFTAVFGASEIVARMPGILASLIILWLLFALLKAHIDRPILFMTLMFYAVSGALAINRSPNGTGLYVMGALMAFWYSERAGSKEKNSIRARKLSFWAMCLTCLTYLEGIMHIPGLLWIHRKELWQERVKSLIRYLALPGLLGLLYLLFFFVLPESLFGHPTGALEHLRSRSGNLGIYVNLVPFVERSSAVFSPFLMALVALSMVSLLLHRKSLVGKGLLKRSMVFYAPHFMVWLLFFPADFHELLDYPIFFICMALGTQALVDAIRHMARGAWLLRGLVVFLVPLFLLTGYQSYVLHVDTAIAKERSLTSFDEEEWWGPIAFARKLGLKSLAFRVLEDDPACTDAVSADVGGAFASFYLRGRANARISPDEAIATLRLGGETPTGLRYLGLRCDRGPDRCVQLADTAYRRYQLVHEGRVTFVLYDLAKRDKRVVELESGDHDSAWSEQHGSPETRAKCFLERRRNQSSP